MPLIYLFGPDGVGKTTHADLVARYLRGKGFRVHRTTVKHHHTFAYVAFKLLVAAGVMDQSRPHQSFSPHLGKRLRTPWKVLELLSLLPAVVYRVLVPLLLGIIVVCDRYVIDTIVVLSYFLNDPSLLTGTTAKVVLSLIPGNALLIHLDADTPLILKRKPDEALTSEIIEYYRQAYNYVSAKLGVRCIKIDTSTTTTKNVHETLLRLIGASP